MGVNLEKKRRPRWTQEEEDRLRVLRTQGHTFDAIGQVLRRDRQSVWAKWQRMQDKPRPRKPAKLADPGETTIVGIIGDTHLPFCLPGYLEFCVSTFERHGVNKVVHIGDFMDNHAINYHEHDPDGLSAGREYETAIEEAGKWYAAFPSLTWCQGNHDRLPARRMMTAGLPRRLLRKRLFDAPDSWEAVDSAVIDGVLYTHGVGAGGGITGPRLLALRRAQSCVIGHFHYNAGVMYMPAADGSQRFGMGVGCGVDRAAYAFDYAREMGSMALGCGIVIGGRVAIYEPMPCP